MSAVYRRTTFRWVNDSPNTSYNRSQESYHQEQRTKQWNERMQAIIRFKPSAGDFYRMWRKSEDQACHALIGMFSIAVMSMVAGGVTGYFTTPAKGLIVYTSSLFGLETL